MSRTAKPSLLPVLTLWKLGANWQNVLEAVSLSCKMNRCQVPPSDIYGCVGNEHNKVYRMADKFTSLNGYSMTWKNNDAMHKANYTILLWAKAVKTKLDYHQAAFSRRTLGNPDFADRRLGNTNVRQRFFVSLARHYRFMCLWSILWTFSHFQSLLAWKDDYVMICKEAIVAGFKAFACRGWGEARGVLVYPVTTQASRRAGRPNSIKNFNKSFRSRVITDFLLLLQNTQRACRDHTPFWDLADWVNVITPCHGDTFAMSGIFYIWIPVVLYCVSCPSCEIWGSRGGDYEQCYLLGCDAV
jgi:hypothetical protein